MRSAVFATTTAFFLKPLPLPAQQAQYLPATPLFEADGLQGFELRPVVAESAIQPERPLYPSAFALGAVLGALGASLIAGRPARVSRRRALAPVMLTDAELKKYNAQAAKINKDAAAKETQKEVAFEKERKKAVAEQLAQRKAFEKQVEANRLKKEKEKAQENKRLAAEQRAVQGRVVRTTPRKASTSPTSRGLTQGSTSLTAPRNKVQQTPSQAFERALAPIYVPPAIAKQRPDLVKINTKSASTRPVSPTPAATTPTRAVTPTRAAKTPADRQAEQEKKKAVAQMEAQRKLFEKQVEANRLKKQKDAERAAKGLAPLPTRSASPPPARKVNVAQKAPAKPKTNLAKDTSGESASQAFERIFAPIFIPPSVAKKRPELVSKYKSSDTPTKRASVTKPKIVAKPRVTKSGGRVGASSRLSRPDRMEKKGTPSRPRGVVKPARVTKRTTTQATTRVKGVVKPTSTSKTTKKAESQSPSQFIDGLLQFGKK
jgi:hypothetical protein